MGQFIHWSLWAQTHWSLFIWNVRPTWYHQFDDCEIRAAEVGGAAGRWGRYCGSHQAVQGYELTPSEWKQFILLNGGGENSKWEIFY